MSTDRINADEALRVIDEMLVHTRRKTAVAGEFFIAWGIIIFLATGLMWLLHELGLYRFIWVNWLSAMLLGSAYSAWKGRHLKQQTGPVSYSDKAVRGTWIALCIAFFLVNLVVPLAHKSVQPLIVFDAVMGGVWASYNGHPPRCQTVRGIRPGLVARRGGYGLYELPASIGPVHGHHCTGRPLAGLVSDSPGP
ncbi:hypothetical protein ACFL4U_04050 [Candidatus Neomarinimicrobiota bacterium]